MVNLLEYIFSPSRAVPKDAPTAAPPDPILSGDQEEPVVVDTTNVQGISSQQTAPDQQVRFSDAPVTPVHDTFQQDQILFLSRNFKIDDREILAGTRVYIVNQLTGTEYVVFSNEHMKHFICHASDLLKYPVVNSDLSDTSDHTSDYERDYPDIEKARADNDLSIMQDGNKPQEPCIPSSTPMPQQRNQSNLKKRKTADSTMITKADSRRQRRNSLALYNRKIAKAKSKLRAIQRNISTIGEIPEDDSVSDEHRNQEALEPEKVQPNPFIKCLKIPKNFDTNEDSSDEDTDEDGYSDDTDVDDSLNATYVPPSTSHFLNEVGKSKAPHLSKETEAALKHLRLHPDKTPQVNAYRLPIAFFLCRVIYQFAVRQGLHQVEYLNRWLFYAFPESNQEKVHYYLGRIRKRYPKAGLFRTLRELARSLSPDDFMTLQTIQHRSASEGLTDLLIRLRSDIPIVMDVTEAELPSLICQFIKNSERDSDLGTEFRREIIRSRGKPTLSKLHKIVSRVDRLLKPSGNGAISHFDDDKEAIRPHICQICDSEHDNLRDDGTAWPSCGSCMYANRSSASSGIKQTTYNKPRQSTNYKPAYQQRSSNCCLDCKAETQWNTRSRKYFVRCLECHRRNVQQRRDTRASNYTHTREHVPKFQPRNRPNSYADAAKRTSSTYRRDHINEFKARQPYNPRCYRVAVRVKNRSQTAEVTGLFDTGCNLDVISRKACAELRISHLIKPCRRTASVVDGAPVNITGKVYATVHIGDVPYTSEFSVIEHMAGYDMMVGTKFMETSGLLQAIFSATQQKLGANNVRKGN